MKNEKIIAAWDKMKPGGEIKEQIFDDITKKYRQHGKPTPLKPVKILAAAAALVLIVGLVNIQTVIAFIGGLFFVPGFGVTDDHRISYYGLEKPVTAETKYGTLTLEFVSKIKRNGKTELTIYMNMRNISEAAWEQSLYDKNFTISKNKETFISAPDLDKEFFDNWAWVYMEVSTYVYSFPDFPDVNDFDLTIWGEKINISLTNKPNDFAFSKENNGITLALCKINGSNKMLFVDFFSSGNIDNENYVTDWHWGNIRDADSTYYYDENGDKIDHKIGIGTSNPAIAGFGGGSYKITEYPSGEMEIKGLKSNAVTFTYMAKTDGHGEIIEIPVPKDGETIKTDIQIDFGQYSYILSEVRREGNMIYYTDNCETTWNKAEYENYAADKKAIVHFVDFKTKDTEISYYGKITKFEEDAKTIKLQINAVSIIQFGDFDIEFE
jgi:hypothetical protein